MAVPEEIALHASDLERQKVWLQENQLEAAQHSNVESLTWQLEPDQQDQLIEGPGHYLQNWLKNYGSTLSIAASNSCSQLMSLEHGLHGIESLYYSSSKNSILYHPPRL